jgi:hypothetical protein
MPVCKKFADLDMIAIIMPAMPKSWQNDLLKSVKGNIPETNCELLPLLKLIEKDAPTTAPTSDDNAKGNSTQGGSRKEAFRRHFGLKGTMQEASLPVQEVQALRKVWWEA